MARIYLDHAATTPMRPEAIAAMMDGCARWANPSSPHAEGRGARAALEDARARIAAALGWDGEVILTSGVSEAIAIALTRTRAGKVTASSYEHDAVRRTSILPGTGRGTMARSGMGEGAGDGSPARRGARVARPLHHSAAPNGPLSRPGEDFALHVRQHANSETGAIFLPPERAPGDLWLADCAQTAGKLPLPRADLLAVSAHKLGGPPGIGALLVRDLGVLDPTGGQERGYRPGTENLPGALGFAAALEAPRDWFAQMAPLRVLLDDAVRAGGGEVVADAAPRLPTIASYRLPGLAAAAQLIRFDLAGLAVSAGSACSSGSMRPSHVLAAMGWPEAAAREVIRVSFGWTTTRDEVERFADVWTQVARTARARSA